MERDLLFDLSTLYIYLPLYRRKSPNGYGPILYFDQVVNSTHAQRF